MGTPAHIPPLEELYQRHHGTLRRFLRRLLRCDEAAADAAQDAYLRLLRLAPRQPVEDPRAYLFQVAANVARDRLARDETRSRYTEAGAAADDLGCPRPGPEAQTAARQRLHILSRAVAELPPRCREVFLLSRVDGLGNADIAARLGISRNMVEKHIVKALVRCRQALEADDA